MANLVGTVSRQPGAVGKAVTQLRGFGSLNDLLRTLLLHVGCGWPLRETAVQARLAGIADVSDVTLLNRLRQAEDWLRQLCQQLWKDNEVDLEPALKDRPVPTRFCHRKRFQAAHGGHQPLHLAPVIINWLIYALRAQVQARRTFL